MCARHDLEVGSYLLELEPKPAGMGTDVLVYVRLYASEDGSPLWFGAMRLYEDPEWTVDAYGGPPTIVETLDDEVESS